MDARLADWRRAQPDGGAGEIVAFAELASEGGIAYRRERLAGHFTASSWLVSDDGRRTLLTHHRKLGRWLQLGGHADGEEDLAPVALKEAAEATGLTGLTVEPEI